MEDPETEHPDDAKNDVESAPLKEQKCSDCAGPTPKPTTYSTQSRTSRIWECSTKAWKA